MTSWIQVGSGASTKPLVPLTFSRLKFMKMNTLTGQRWLPEYDVPLVKPYWLEDGDRRQLIPPVIC
jgi:hypothetical protein